MFERKIIGLFHNRKGPNKILIIGISQPFNDAIKLLSKEFLFPLKINLYIYVFRPILILILSLIIWIIYPFYTNLINNNNRILLILSIIRIGAYGLIIRGWSSNSIFSLIGAIRSIAQSISYEVIFSLCLLIIFIIINSLNLLKISFFNKLFFFLINIPLIFLFICRITAEVNRTPFDLSEGESELVSGFNIEYRRRNFTLIFLAEYSRLIFIIILLNLLFFNSNYFSILFYWINILFIFFITWVRITFPRIRYDKLIYFCWIYLLPLNLKIFLIYLIYKYYIDILIIFN